MAYHIKKISRQSDNNTAVTNIPEKEQKKCDEKKKKFKFKLKKISDFDVSREEDVCVATT